MIRYYPKRGQILACDFSVGFMPPEMTKARPVIVLSSRPGPWDPETRFNGPLVAIVPLSSQKPDPHTDCHFVIPRQNLPQLGYFQKEDSWVKGDMIYQVSYRRLDLYALGKRDPNTGKRMYFSATLPQDIMREVHKCVLHGLEFGYLADRLK